jgi:acetylornithine deacetylase
MGVAERLAELVAFDTRNPEGDERPIVHKLATDLKALGAAAVEEAAVGEHAYVYARFGAEPPAVLLNAHVDTVPANSGYTSPPHLLVRRGDRLHGLAAAIRRARSPPSSKRSPRSRPERRAALSVGRTLLGRRGAERQLHPRLPRERSGARPRARHRLRADGLPRGRAPPRHRRRHGDARGAGGPLLARRRARQPRGRARTRRRRARRVARRRGEARPGRLRGALCLNVAGIDGGVAFNVVPTRATLMLSLRPAPGADLGGLLAEAERRVRTATAPHAVAWKTEIESPPFATRELAAFEPLLGPAAEAPVDLSFWTEAARISEQGIDAVVYGPGEIAQAHGADEFVEVAELESARETFARVLEAVAR